MIRVDSKLELQIEQFSGEIRDISNSFLRRHSIDFFGYVKTYNDQSCIVLTTHPKLFHYLYEMNLPFTAPIPQQFIKNQFHYLVPIEGPYNKVMHEVAANFKLFKPLDLVFCGKNYFEMFCFGVNNDSGDMATYYLNHLFEFQQFCFRFQQEANDLIQLAHKNRISLSTPMFEVAKNLISLQKSKNSKQENYKTVSALELTFMLNKNSQSELLKQYKYFELNLNDESIELSRREIQCLQLLLKGFSAQESGEQLFLSKRTVEDHLETVKEKANVRSKLELISKVYQSLVNKEYL